MARTKARGMQVGVYALNDPIVTYEAYASRMSEHNINSCTELLRLRSESSFNGSKESAKGRKKTHRSTRRPYSLNENKASQSSRQMNFFSSTLELYAPIILLLYLALGTIVYHWREGWSFWNSLYFCIISLLTVGYGDISPSNNSMKLFTVFFIYIGLAFVAGTVGLLVGRALASVTEDDDPMRTKKWGMSQNVRDVLWAAMLIFILGSSGTIFYYCNEELSLVDAFYFSMITLATVGYGDVVTSKQSTRIFGTFFVFFGVSMMAFAVGRFAAVLARVEQQKQIDSFVKRGITSEVIEALDADGSGYIDKAEFLEYMLVQTGAAKRSDIRKFSEMFYSLDADGGGTLDINDAAVPLRNYSVRRGAWV